MRSEKKISYVKQTAALSRENSYLSDSWPLKQKIFVKQAIKF